MPTRGLPWDQAREAAMDVLLSIGAIWVGAAALFTFGVSRAGALDAPFQVERVRPVVRPQSRP